MVDPAIAWCWEAATGSGASAAAGDRRLGRETGDS